MDHTRLEKLLGLFDGALGQSGQVDVLEVEHDVDRPIATLDNVHFLDLQRVQAHQVHLRDSLAVFGEGGANLVQQAFVVTLFAERVTGSCLGE